MREAQRGELAAELAARVEPLYRAQLGRLVAQQLGAFERELTLALAADQGAFAAAAAACGEAALQGFAAARADVAVPDTPLNGAAALPG